MLNRNQIFFRFVLFSDEATFHNTGQLNRHNFHYWSVENPHYREVNHQHRWGLIVWCGILNGILSVFISLTKMLMVIIIYTFYNKYCWHCLKISIWTQDNYVFFNRMVRLHTRVAELDII